MSRCYHCGKILKDSWIKSEGARLMGKTTGPSKARPTTAARAAQTRWAKAKAKAKAKQKKKKKRE
jgi:hypothetical protein